MKFIFFLYKTVLLNICINVEAITGYIKIIAFLKLKVIVEKALCKSIHVIDVTHRPLF